jgi:RNA polymerase sigma-70 factor (ECF subfamily)
MTIAVSELSRTSAAAAALVTLLSALQAMVRDDRTAPLHAEEDRADVEAAKGGDPQAYESLVRRHMRRTLSIAWGIVRNAHDAEDLTQEAFIRGFEKIGSFRSGEAFGPWIYRIVTNLALDSLRRGKRHPTEELSPELPSASRSDARSSESMAAQIDAAIESLPQMQGLVARLFLVEELAHGEIALITGLSEGTIRSHLSHARRKLQQMLGELREEES